MLKKIMALVLALAMLLAMGTVALAAGDDGRTVGGKTDTYTGSNASEATNMAATDAIPLTKSIIFVNANGSKVYEPNISFGYAVEPASIDESTYTVKDGTTPDPVTAYVHPGPDGSVTGTTIAFGVKLDGTATTAVTTSANGVDVERTGSLSLDISKFERPGVYRYKITETPTPSDVTSVGLVARTDDYNSVRFLDVYIHRNASDALEMYGAVIFKSTTSTAGQDNITTSTTKTTGYGPATGSSKDDATVDRYTTYDVIVKKTVDGNMADKNHEFPFYVTVSNTINGAKFSYTADNSETFTGATVSSGVGTLNATSFQIGSDEKTSNLTLKHNDTITITGVPSNQETDLSIVVKEFNDTYDSYTPSVTVTSGTISMISDTAMVAQSGSNSTSAFAIKENDVANQTITINNSLSEISPTGIVLRIAPYALMLGAGIVLLIVSRHRKAKVED